MRYKAMEIIIETMSLNGGEKDQVFLSNWGINDRIVIRTKAGGFVVGKAELKKAMAFLDDWDLEFNADTQSECID